MKIQTDKGVFEAPDDASQDEVAAFLKDHGAVRTTNPIDDAIQSSPTNSAIKSGIGAIFSGVGKAVPHVLDMARTGGHYLNKGIDYLEGQAGIEPAKQPEFDPSYVTDKVGKAVGGWHESTGPVEDVLEAAGEGAVGGLAAPGSMLARLGLYGALPGAASEVAGQLTRGAGGEGLPEAGARIVTSAVTPMGARKLLTPKTIRSPQRLMDNAVIEREMPGVQTAGQAVGDEKIMGRELARNKNLNEEQDTARTRVFTRKAGVEAPTITTGPGGTVDTALNQASDALERMANRTAIPDHPEIRNDLANFQNNRVHRPHFQSIQNTIYDTLGRNTLFTGPQSTMSGNDYQHLRSAIHSAAASSGSPGEANALRRFATILDDAMDRRNPGAREGWANARRLWENSKIVEDAAAKVPSGRPSGKEIERSAKKVIGGERFVRGVENPPPGSPRSDYTELSRATQRVMPKLKPREAPSWFGGSEAAGTVLGGLVTQAALMHGGMGLEHAATPAILGGMMGAGVGHFSPIKGAFNAAANRYVASPLGQRHIRNQAFPLLPQQAGQRRNSLILRALAQGQRAQEGSQ